MRTPVAAALALTLLLAIGASISRVAAARQLTDNLRRYRLAHPGAEADPDFTPPAIWPALTLGGLSSLALLTTIALALFTRRPRPSPA